MKRLPVVLAAVLLARCATLSHNEFEQIAVTSTPSGADVTLDCGRGPTRIGTTPLTLMVRRRDTGCSVAMAKDGWIGMRVQLHRVLSSAVWGNFLGGAIAAAVVSNSNVDFSAQNGTPSGGTVNVSASGSGSISPATAGAVVMGAGVLVDAASGALYSHVPKRVDVTLTRR